MLEGNIVLSDDVKHLLHETDFVVHHRFFNGDNGKILLSCNTRYGIFLQITRGRLYDIRPCIFRTEGVANTNGNPHASNREN